MATKPKKINPTVAGNITVGDNLQALAAKKAEEEKNKIFETIPKWEFVPVLPKYEYIVDYDYKTGKVVTNKNTGHFTYEVFDTITELKELSNSQSMVVSSAFALAFNKGLLAKIVTDVNTKIANAKSFDKNFYLDSVLREAIFENITITSVALNKSTLLSPLRALCLEYFKDISWFLSCQLSAIEKQNKVRYDALRAEINQWEWQDIVTLGVNWANKGIGLIELESDYNKVKSQNKIIYDNISKSDSYLEFAGRLIFFLFGNTAETQSWINDAVNNAAGGYQSYQNNKNQNNNPPPDNDNGNNDDVGSTNWLLIGAVGILVLIFFIKKSRK